MNKQVEKKVLKILIIGAILSFILLVLFGTFKISTQTLVMLKGDMAVSLTPIQENILTDKRNQENITFNVKVENIIFCNAICHYEFVDLKNNTILDNGTFNARLKTQINKTYSIKPPIKGTGQKSYEFNVECVNKKTTLCYTYEDKKNTRSFLTLSYELSKEERDFVEELKIKLLNFLEGVSKNDYETYYLINKQNVLEDYFLEQAVLPTKVTNLNDNNNFLKEESDYAKELWSQEEYESLNYTLKDLNFSLNNLNTEIYNMNFTLNTAIKKHQEAYYKLTNFKKNLNVLENISKNLAVLGENYTLVEENYVQIYQQIIFMFNNKTNNYSYVENQLDTLYKDLNKKENITNIKIDLLKNYGLTLLNENISQEKNDSIKIILEICLKLENNIILFEENITNQSNTSINKTKMDVTLENYNSTKEFIEQYCHNTNPEILNLTQYNFSIRTIPENISINYSSRINLSIKEHKPICCIFNDCVECCNIGECEYSENNYPLILIHGHAALQGSLIEHSLLGFNNIRTNLVTEGYIDGGTILPTEIENKNEKGILGRYRKPVIFGTTYYLDAYNTQGEIINYPSKDQSITEYAKRLNRTIEIIKYKTGAKKVNILAYSMGGLVTRQYLIDFGEESVNKVIFLGTPNKGISGNINTFCPIIGAKIECQEMTSTSDFIKNLNKNENKPQKVDVYTIGGKGCLMNTQQGDGIVLLEKSKLDYAKNYEVTGDCKNKNLHEKLLNKQEVYEIIKTILLE